MCALSSFSNRAFTLAPGRRGRSSRWFSQLAVLGAALALAGCDRGEEPIIISGVGQVWAYSTPTKSAVSGDYRPLFPLTSDCPQPIGIGDNCVYSRCKFTPSELPALQPVGTIALSGGLEPVVLEPDEDNFYAVERDGPLFVGGEKLTFDVTGEGDIGAATITLDAPRFVTVTEPQMVLEPDPEDPEAEPEPLEPLAIDRSRDLDVKWNPQADGTVRISLSLRQTFEDTDQLQDIRFSCRYPAYLGKGTFSKENLSALPVSSDPEAASLWVGTETSGRRHTGSWEHWFVVSAYEARPITLD